MIKIKGLCKSYTKVIFDDFNLEIKAGQFVMLSGESGRGKSTLLNIIGMLDNEFEGDVEILGYQNPEIGSKIGRSLLNNDISYVFQNFGLIDNKSIYENLVIISTIRKLSKKQKCEEIKRVLKRVNLVVDIDSPVYELSGGEQQRVAIAKVILKSPQLILCDEPTGSLDEENAHAILQILSELNKLGSTIIVASHDPLTKQYANMIIEL